MLGNVPDDALRNGLPTMEEQSPTKLDSWVKRLEERQMPAFARVARSLTGVSEHGAGSATDMARVILKDATLTARVLKIANSIMYSPAGKRINTVTRAIVVLGFNAVRGLALSVSLIESLAEARQRERVSREMARAFHAAVQARDIAERRGDESPEEVFIAALLHNLGRIAFWSFAAEQADELEAALAEDGAVPEQAEREVLGFEFKDLSLGLSRAWRLSGLLEEVLENEPNAGPRVTSVVVAHELAAAVEQGWDSVEVKDVVQELCGLLRLAPESAKQVVQENARQARKIASSYGLSRAGTQIPLPEKEPIPAEADAVDEPESKVEYHEPDPMLQLQILRDIAVAVESDVDVSVFIDTVLEGIVRSIGMDRVVLALVSHDRRVLSARQTLGWDAELMKNEFRFEVGPPADDLFGYVLAEETPQWVGPHSSSDLRRRVPARLNELARERPFFVSPLVIGGRSLGVVYADRKPSGRDLDGELFGSFRHFCQQAALGIAQIPPRARKRQ